MKKAYFTDDCKTDKLKLNNQDKIFLYLDIDDISVFARFDTDIYYKALYNKELELLFSIDNSKQKENLYKQIEEDIKKSGNFIQVADVYYNKNHLLNLNIYKEDDYDIYCFWTMIFKDNFGGCSIGDDTYFNIMRDNYIDNKELDLFDKDFDKDYPEYRLFEKVNIKPSDFYDFTSNTVKELR